MYIKIHQQGALQMAASCRPCIGERRSAAALADIGLRCWVFCRLIETYLMAVPL